ncbi:MAG: hypothetical protein MJZ35_07950 [Bacteroidaceae bacterium]|nr:hypothetical protein [Bacteroidaceae bacterium]
MYTILKNQEQQLLLTIEYQATDPDDPMLVYDGGDTALLIRDWDSTIKLSSISEEASHALMGSSEIRVHELHNEVLLRDYVARIRIVKNVKAMIQ